MYKIRLLFRLRRASRKASRLPRKKCIHKNFAASISVNSGNWSHCGRAKDGTRRIEIRKLPFFLPIRSKRAKFSAPPLLDSRIGLPPESSAVFGARLRASSTIFAILPRTRTVSARCSPGLSGDESASRSRAAKTTAKEGAWWFAQEMFTIAGPGTKSIGGRTTRVTGEDARTNAGCPAIEAWLESASPQKPRPRSSKRSVNEATRGTEAISTEDDAASEGGITAVLTRSVRPAMEAKS